jgi:hypothetical protein
MGNVKISPVPATDLIHIATAGKIMSVEVLNSMGQRVLFSNSKTSESMDIDVRDLSDGIYFINVSSDRGMESGKFVIMKN